MKSRFAATLGLLLPLSCLAADPPPAPPPAQTPGPVVTELGPVIVTGKRNPLDEIDRNLKALQQSLPGPDGAPKKGFVDWYIANNDPNNLSESKKQQLQDRMGINQPDRPPDLQLQRP